MLVAKLLGEHQAERESKSDEMSYQVEAGSPGDMHPRQESTGGSIAKRRNREVVEQMDL